MSGILPFEKRLELLETAISKPTPEALLAELQSYPAIGPTCEEFFGADDAEDLD